MSILQAVPLGSAVTYFQAIVLGFLQGVTELFPISSLGHTVLFPTLFGWNSLVKAQSQSESFWLAFVVTLHLGSALGLLAYYWRDWVKIVTAPSSARSPRGRSRAPNERLAWLIIVASIPAGLFGLVFEHQLRTLTAKPEIAAIFLMVNGCVLFAAERFRRRAEVRELALREGAKPDGGRELATLEYREALLVGVAQSTALVAGISRDGVTMGTGLARGLDHSDSARFAFLLATPIILAAAIFKMPDLLGHLGDGVRGQAVVGVRLVAAVTAVFTVRFLVGYFKTKTLTPFAVYCMLFGWRWSSTRRRRPRRTIRAGHPRRRAPSLTADARAQDAAEDVRDPQPGLEGGRAAAPDQPARGQAGAPRGARAGAALHRGGADLRQPRALFGTRYGRTTTGNVSNRRSKRP
jgi:undecaprenyl-diphosphatase